MKTKATRPEKEAAEPVYSDFDHIIDMDIVKLLQDNPNGIHAQHAAWNFCGYIWFDGENFIEEIWQYRQLIETRANEDINELISSINAEYGSE